MQLLSHFNTRYGSYSGTERKASKTCCLWTAAAARAAQLPAQAGTTSPLRADASVGVAPPSQHPPVLDSLQLSLESPFTRRGLLLYVMECVSAGGPFKTPLSWGEEALWESWAKCCFKQQSFPIVTKSHLLRLKCRIQI